MNQQQQSGLNAYQSGLVGQSQQHGHQLLPDNSPVIVQF